MDQLNRNSQRNKYVIGVAIIVALLGYCSYLFVTKNTVIKNYELALTQKQKAIDSVKTDRVYLQADLDAASARIDQVMSKNAGLQDSLQNKKTIILDLRTQIKEIVADRGATREQLLKARDLIGMLNDKTQAYELYIAQLEKDNNTLTGENELLLRERDQSVENNIALKMAGSVLHASNIHVAPIHERRNETEKGTSRAKKADKLRITFDLDENHITGSGTKQIYVRIITPNGSVLHSKDLSGTMNTIKGNKLDFSVLREVDIVRDQPVNNVTVEWVQNDTYLPGPYKIELYNQGYKIGEGSAELR